MNRNKSLLAAGLVLAAVTIGASSRADATGRIDYLTMNQPTALPGVVLAAGTYGFEVVEGHADIVRVTDRATRRVLYLGFTDLVRRPARSVNPLRFGEAPRGQAIPINVWFPVGASQGHAFRHR